MIFYYKSLNNNFNLFPTGSNDKPMLLENNLLKKIKKKKIEIKKNSYTNIVKNNCFEFIKNNYGILIIIIVLILLLYYRYRDVKKKREKFNNQFYN